MGHSNWFNFALAVLVMLPSVVFYFLFLNRCGEEGGGEKNAEVGEVEKRWGEVCEWGRENPLYLVNVMFLLNVDVLFWFIGLLQGSFWLIDPYWAFIPVLIGHFFAAHPAAEFDSSRSTVVLSLIWFWSIRLTYTYFRREDWQWGDREDWRYADLRKQYGRQWWWISIFLVFLSQHVFLVGLTLPFYSVYSSAAAWNVWDGIATFLCISGVIIAHVADTRLYEFVYKNNILKDIGAPKVPLLESGLWRYSRHPNYFGEQVFWWGLSLFAWNLGQSWAVIGTVVNSACLAYVTVLVERKMVKDKSRAEVYRGYQQTTSVLIPWFKWKRSGNEKGKSKAG